jgi:hypothetical protein
VYNINKKTFGFFGVDYIFAPEFLPKGINNSSATGFWNMEEEKQLLGLANSRRPRLLAATRRAFFK